MADILGILKAYEVLRDLGIEFPSIKSDVKRSEVGKTQQPDGILSGNTSGQLGFLAKLLSHAYISQTESNNKTIREVSAEAEKTYSYVNIGESGYESTE